MSPTVEIVVRRNQNGSVLAFKDSDHAESTLADHRKVLSSVYEFVDRRHGENGDVVARVQVDPEANTVERLEIPTRFRRDLEASRAIALAEDVRHYATSEKQLVADGGEVIEARESRIAQLWSDELHQWALAFGAVGATYLAFGVRPLVPIAVRHLRDPAVTVFSSRTLATYLSEILLETDTVPLSSTFMAWVGIVFLVASFTIVALTAGGWVDE